MGLLCDLFVLFVKNERYDNYMDDTYYLSYISLNYPLNTPIHSVSNVKKKRRLKKKVRTPRVTTASSDDPTDMDIQVMGVIV